MKHVPDSRIDFSDIPESTEEVLSRARRASKFSCWENQGAVRLDQILGWCLQEHAVDTLLVTSRPHIGTKGGSSFDQGVDVAVRSIFESNVFKSFRASGWPGTELISEPQNRQRHLGRVYVIRFDPTVLQTMASVENELFDWRHSGKVKLPEDICVFRAKDRVPILVTVTHERDAWVISDKTACPPGFQKSDFGPRELYIGTGPYFCRL